MSGHDRVIERAARRREAHDHGPATRGGAIEPDPPGIEPILSGVDHADREPVINNARRGQHLGLADRISDAGANGRG